MLRLWLTDLFRTRVKELGRGGDVIIENIEEDKPAKVTKEKKPAITTPIDELPRCINCLGTGLFLGEKCEDCNGTGRISQ